MRHGLVLSLCGSVAAKGRVTKKGSSHPPSPWATPAQAKAVSPACPWQPGDSHPVVAWATSSQPPTLAVPLHH